MILNVLIQIVVWAGLWIPVMYTGIFFITLLIAGGTWAAVQLWFFIGLSLSFAFGIMWFVRFTLKIGKKKSKDLEK